MKKLRITAAFLILLVLTTVTACNPLGETETERERYVEVEKGDLLVTVSGIGNIRALVALQSSVIAGIEKFYKGNDRAFDMAISMDEGAESAGFDQGYRDMMEMVRGSNR